jgi:putative restriction endonuclease
MTQAEIFKLFDGIRVARVDHGYAPHKPLLLFILLEMILENHPNVFEYSEIDSKLKRLLERFGSSSATESRNQPFLRLQNDGILEISTRYSALVRAEDGLTANQLLENGAFARMNGGAYDSLRNSPELISEVARRIANRFLSPELRAAALSEAAPRIARFGRRFWWVSQNQTFREEVTGNFMWSPKTNADGRANPFYNFMTEVVPGDIVFSFSGARIKAIGVALQPAVSCPKPSEFGMKGNTWLNDGWMVEVAFYELFHYSIRPADYMNLLAPVLPSRYSPIRSDGTGNQMYLAAVPRAMGDQLMAIIGPIAQTYADDVFLALTSMNFALEVSEEIEGVEERSDIGPTEKQRLISARRGQGIFRVGVSLIESRCRVTLTSNKIHLIASHIKPWSKSTDEERLSRYNGLLLAPHIDHLFDRGYISFRDDGSMLVSRRTDTEVLEQWHIDAAVPGFGFKTEQRVFLEYHRDARFLG